MSKDMVELAFMIKGGEGDASKTAAKQESFIIGTVEAEPPNLKVRTDPEILLTKENILVAAHVLKEYEREFEIFDAEIQFTDENCGSTNVASAHSHSIESLNIDSQTLRAKGKIKWTDTLKIGDKVILIPDGGYENYILIDKVVSL